jgi:glycogen synthase
MNYDSWLSQVDEFLDDPFTKSKWDGKEANKRILELALGLKESGA